MGKKHEHEHEHEYHISIPPTTKTSVLGAINMLGLAKRQFVALRYFNAAGADPDAEIGALRDPETHLIPRAMTSIEGHLGDFEVFGGDYPTADGTAIRDYIHVSDLADVAAKRRPFCADRK